MTTSEIDICSQALTLLRANTISSFEEDSEEAQICSVLFSTFEKDIFSRYPWSFSKKMCGLNRMNYTPLKGYKYAYYIPNDCSRIWGVFNGDKTINDYEIVASKDEDATVILSNEESVVIEYNKIIQVRHWPGYFVNYAIYAFADMLAGPITDDDSIVDKMHRLAYGAPNENEKGGKFGIATNVDAQQKPSTAMECDILINARFA